MSWVGVGTAAVGLIGSQMSDDKNGGAGTQNQSKQPWAPAAPWLMSNVTQGQALQDKYTAQPFNPQQNAAYNNSYGQSDYMRALVPSLLGQMQGQQVGFDPNNPTAKPKAWDWNGLLGDGAAGGHGGPNMGQQSVQNAMPPPQPQQQAATAQESPRGLFTDQSGAYGANRMYGGFEDNVKRMGGTMGSYGDFKYGQEVKPGSQAETDQRMYFAMGGSDPLYMYSERPMRPGYETY